MPRNEVIEFKVTAEEKAEIKRKATTGAVSVSEFVRAAALGMSYFPEDPIPRESPTDAALKAEVRQAVENEEPYEVKVEPGTIQPKDQLSEDEIRAKAKALVIEKGLRYQVAYAQVVQEAAES